MSKFLHFLVISSFLHPLLSQAQAFKDFDVKPCCNCDTVWERSDVMEFISILTKTTSEKTPVWPGYYLNDAIFIINAVQKSDGEYCLALIKKGIPVSYGHFKNTLQMLTPLYSYYLDYKDMKSIPDESYFTTAKDAPEIVRWMKEMNVSSAVYMPVDFSKLPFKIPTTVKVQLAIHEAFHINVMLKYWYTGKGAWPKWDKQPDRKQVQACYTFNDSNRVIIQNELSILADMVDALIDKKNTEACILGKKYVESRDTRYQELINVKPKLADEKAGDCLTAESLFEIEEGLADYASWTIMFNKGIAGKDELLRRYRAKQNDHFYLSGCMLMHAITMMSNESTDKIINKIVNAPTINEGSLFTIFKDELGKYCK